MRNTNGRKRFWYLAALAGFALFGLFAPNAGRFLVVDAPEPADVILVLAGETERRPARALDLLRQGYGRKVMIDVPVGVKIYQFTQLQLAQQYIRDLPQASAIVVCPIEGLSTRDEARDAEKCLNRENGKSVLIVTSDFHTRRALSIFRHELHGKFFSVTAVRDSVQFGTRWWTQRQWAKTAVDEWLRLLWWEVVERWQ